MTKTIAAAPFLYCDIETLPSQDTSVLADIEAKFPLPILDLASIKADGRLTDPAKIEADVAKKTAAAQADHAAALEKRLTNIDAEYRKTALDGASGHLASIAWAFDEEVVVALRNEDLDPVDATWMGQDGVEHDYIGETIFSDGFSVDKRLETITEGEAEMLEEFFDELEDHLFNLAYAAYETAVVEGKYAPPASNVVDIEPFSVAPVLVAHFADFDIRFIWQRAIALGVPVPAWWPVNASKFASDRVQDTMIQWAGHTGRIGLDRLCRALGVPGKGDMDGSGVWDAVRAGRIEEVVEYNRGDVRRLRSVHRRMRGLPVLAGDHPDASTAYDVQVRVSDDELQAVKQKYAEASAAAKARVAEAITGAGTYVEPDQFVFDEATSTVRVIPTHAELTVTEKTEEGWTAEGALVVDAPANEAAR